MRVLFGTPEFISPEIINYEPIGFQCDMWSGEFIINGNLLALLINVDIDGHSGSHLLRASLRTVSVYG